MKQLWEQAEAALLMFEKHCDQASDVRVSPMPDLSGLKTAVASTTASGLPLGWEARHTTLTEDALVAKGAIMKPTIYSEQQRA